MPGDAEMLLIYFWPLALRLLEKKPVLAIGVTCISLFFCLCWNGEVPAAHAAIAMIAMYYRLVLVRHLINARFVAPRADQICM